MRIGTRRHERGANLVEAAITLPLLIIMLAVVVDMGRAYFTAIAVIDAAREGARYGVNDPDSGRMCLRAMAEAQDQPLPVTLTCDADPGQGPGTPVSVTISCDFPLIMGGLVGRSSFAISYSAAFRIR